jgi:sugar phosphate isomerase/epimerase
MKIGLSTSMFKGETLEFILKVATYLEMDWVEIKTELLKESMDEAADLIRSKPEYSKIEFFSVHSAHKKINLVNIKPEQIERHEKDLDFARKIGSDRVVLHAGYSGGGDHDEELEIIIPTIEHYLEFTEGTDIQILIENTMFGRNKLCSDPRELRSVLKKIDHPRLGATLDIINLLGVEEEKQKKRYKKIKDWVRHIHINSLPVYEGDFKMKKFVKYLLKELKFKKQLKNKKEEKYNIPVILEGKTSLAREMQFYNDLSRKLK